MGRNRGGDNRKRSFVKAMTFRVTIIVADTVITYAISHRYDITIGFVVFTNVASTLIYYLHERIWSHVRWGDGKKK